MLPQSRIVWLLLQAGLASQTCNQPLNLSQLQDEHISTLEAAHPCRCSEITRAAPALLLASLSPLSQFPGELLEPCFYTDILPHLQEILGYRVRIKVGAPGDAVGQACPGIRGWAPIPVQAPAGPRWTRDQSPSPAGLSVHSCTMTSPDISSLGDARMLELEGEIIGWVQGRGSLILQRLLLQRMRQAAPEC